MGKGTYHFLISSITSRNPDARGLVAGGGGGVKPQGAQANSLASVINLRVGLRLESRARLLSDIVRVVWEKHSTFSS